MSHPDLALAESVSTTNASYFILVYILVLIYCCFALAVVCDVYFVPALQKLSYTYDLPPDIAGSTLMALGASVPELFASLIGVFVTEDDIGTGSIIGSSCFNLIAVPAACAFVASATFTRKLSISPMPVIRNSAFYAITILVLLLIIKDNKVDIPEAIILLLFFVMYMAFMIFSVQIGKNHSDTSKQSSLTSSYISTDSAIAECHNNNNNNSDKGNLNQAKHHHPDHNHNNEQQAYGQFYFAKDSNNIANYHAINERTPLVSANNNNNNRVNDYHQITMPTTMQQQHNDTFLNKVDDSDSFRLDIGIAIKNSTCLVKNHTLDDGGHFAGVSCARGEMMKKGGGVDKASSKGDNDHEGEEKENWVSSNWILVTMLPLTLSMKVLTPCKFKNTCWTIWTFLISIALIGGLTYISVWMVHLFGKCVGLPETVAGMTILSWGTGIPELIASIVLIKKTAQADMAICNTIGSNVIDISFCLSLPWIVKCVMNRAEGLKPEVEIQSAALPWTSFTLLLSVFLLILVLKLHNWVLSYSVGVWLTVVYVVFVGSATYLESTFSETGLDLLAYI